MEQESFLRIEDVLKRFPVSKSAWYRGMKDGIYPQSVKLSTRTTAWRLSDIDALIECVGE